MRRIGIDTGGTFTDCVLVDDRSGQTWVAKVTSRPAEPDAAALHGINRLLDLAPVTPDGIDFVAHGTTIATNAMITGDHARAGMLTTAGCRDVLEIATQQRPHLYALHQPSRPPLIPRDRRLEVPGRIAFDGRELAPIDEAAVEAAARQLAAAGVQAIAIAGLFSFVNPAHEERLEAVVRRVIPDVYVVSSARVSPELREYPRFATVAVNAALAPLLDRYIGQLMSALATSGIVSDLFVMQCNGGVATARRSTGESAHRLVLSGPAAGILGGAAISSAAGLHDVVTLDMGGTSADIGVVTKSRARSRIGMVLEGHVPLQIPTLEVEAIGAGGGSVAWVDAGGALRVGPMSVGADPGPACYGAGGTQATVTDAHLVLGRLAPEKFLGGEIPLDVGAAERAVGGVAAALGCGLKAAAGGILAVAEANMVGAIRKAAARHGDDLRDFALVAAGGAGPLHGMAIATELGMSGVCVPPSPGLLSALGLLVSDIRHDVSASALMFGDRPDERRLWKTLGDLVREGDDRLAADGVPARMRTLECAVDVRYVGQEWVLTVPTRPRERVHDIVERFHSQHERVYGHSAPDEPVELVTARAVGWGRFERPALRPARREAEPQAPRSRDVWFWSGSGPTRTTIVDRESLSPGDEVHGPAIVEQLDSTTVLPPGSCARVDPSGAMLLEVRP